jgi:multidrug efflux pump subunit AcrB
MYILRVKNHLSGSRNVLVLFQQVFERAFERLRGTYQRTLEQLVAHRRIFIPLFLAPCFCAFLLGP